MIGGVLYLNDGDWVESCSALVEDARGNMEILRWADPLRDTPSRAVPAEAAGQPAPRLYPRRTRRLEPGPIPGVAAHLKILIVTDAWKPQVNGVVRTLEVLGERSDRAGPYRALRHARRPLHLPCPPILKSDLPCFRAAN